MGKAFIMALILDAVYQYIELRWFWPGEALLVALMLAIVPYLLLRGSVTRLSHRKGQEESHERSDRQANV